MSSELLCREEEVRHNSSDAVMSGRPKFWVLLADAPFSCSYQSQYRSMVMPGSFSVSYSGKAEKTNSFLNFKNSMINV